MVPYLELNKSATMESFNFNSGAGGVEVHYTLMRLCGHT